MRKSTLREAGPAPPSSAHLLTCVLHYDDLLAPPAQTFRLLGAVRTVRIGRTEDQGPAGWRGLSELRLQDPWMSGRHALIERREDGLLLRDDGSANGTYVNGAPAGEHLLRDGDLIELGHSLLVYRAVDERLARALPGPGAAAPRFGPVPTYCPEVAALLQDLGRIAPSSESVLILGETGAGKELAAALVHRLSGRPGALRAVDCGAVPESLFESTFFGHLRGAFTGAATSQPGEIVRADRGTLFLDEVGNMSAPAQAKLLRVLEDGRVTAVGGAEAQRVDVRWLSATNRDLLHDEAFRSDLLRRLGGFVAHLPPLRRRREDLGALTAHLLREAGHDRAMITAAAGRRLFAGTFPGNIRELRTTLRSAALLSAGGPIDLPHLPAAPPRPSGHASEPGDEQPGGRPALPPRPPARRPTREQVDAVLRRCGGNITRCAEELGISRRQLHRWLKR